MPQSEGLGHHVIRNLTLGMLDIRHDDTKKPSKWCFCLFVTHIKFMVEGEGVIPIYPFYDGKDIIGG